jgi:hypothetical protein
MAFQSTQKMEVKNMKKKILMVSITLLALAMLVIPVMAKASNAVGKNPNVVPETTTSGTDVLDLNLPSGVTNRWFGTEAHIIVKPADKFYNPTEIVLDVTANPMAENSFLQWLINTDYRATWVKMTQTGYLALFAFFGLTPPTNVPTEGVYIWGSK